LFRPCRGSSEIVATQSGAFPIGVWLSSISRSFSPIAGASTTNVHPCRLSVRMTATKKPHSLSKLTPSIVAFCSEQPMTRRNASLSAGSSRAMTWPSASGAGFGAAVDEVGDGVAGGAPGEQACSSFWHKRGKLKKNYESERVVDPAPQVRSITLYADDLRAESSHE
jgi:hypothetical protein